MQYLHVIPGIVLAATGPDFVDFERRLSEWETGAIRLGDLQLEPLTYAIGHQLAPPAHAADGSSPGVSA